jgi:hypothetical protein
MSRFYFRLVLIPLLIFTAVLVLIRAQPYDDHELRQLLLPDGCPTPCFMGIRPGVTTVDEAIKILNASGWVEPFDYKPDANYIELKWNANSPSWLEKNENSNSSVSIVDSLVNYFLLDTRLTLGEIQLSLGQTPFQFTGADSFEGHSYLYYSAIYQNSGISISASKVCDNQKGRITYQSKAYLTYAQIKLDILSMYKNSWIDVLRTYCD